MSSSANSPLQKGIKAVNGDRIIEDTETRKNMEPVDAVGRMAAKLQTEEGKEIYRQRKKIVEPVFGRMKFNLRFRGFLLRGLDEAGGEFDGLTSELQAICYLLEEARYPSSLSMDMEWKN